MKFYPLPQIAGIACLPACLFACLFTSSIASAQLYIEDIIIQAEFRPINLMETPNSISLISAEDISNRSANFLTEVLGSTPNLNYSSGKSVV